MSDNRDLPSAEDLAREGTGLRFDQPARKGKPAPEAPLASPDPEPAAPEQAPGLDADLSKLPGGGDLSSLPGGASMPPPTGAPTPSPPPEEEEEPARPERPQADQADPGAEPAPEPADHSTGPEEDAPSPLSSDSAPHPGPGQAEPVQPPPGGSPPAGSGPQAHTQGPFAPLPPGGYGPVSAPPLERGPTDAPGPAPAHEPSAGPKPVEGPSAPPPLQVSQGAADFITAPEPPRRETVADLAAERVLREDSEPPLARLLRRSTFGLVKLGESPEQQRQRRWAALAKTGIARHRRVAVLSQKGGVGKTTNTTMLGHTFASLRGDLVVAVDANPDRGTLGEKVGSPTGKTVRDLLAFESETGISSWPDARQFLSQAESRLLALASSSDPAVATAFNADDYATVASVLERFAPLMLTDCGTAVTNDVLSGEGGVLDQADQVVVVCGAGVDEARSASATLDWMQAQRWRHLVDTAVVVVNKAPTGRRSSVDYEEVEAHFRTRVAGTVRVPVDEHLQAGGVASLERIDPATRRAFLELAAAVGSQFSRQYAETTAAD